MALTRNQERLLAERAAQLVAVGDMQQLVAYLNQLRTLTEVQLITRLKAYAASRRDELDAERAVSQPDLDFYTGES